MSFMRGWARRWPPSDLPQRRRAPSQARRRVERASGLSARTERTYDDVVGHCCNYVVRENGTRRLYASNWGALSILRDFFWGLDASLAFLSEQEEVDGEDGWYGDVFGEGAIAIDRDARVVVVDGGEIEGHARKLCIRLMRSIWAKDGFELREGSFADVAVQVGVPREMVESEHDAELPLDVDDPKSNGRADQHFDALVIAGGLIRCCRSDQAFLEAGPAILFSLERLATVEEAKSVGAHLRWLNVVLVDATQKTVRCIPYRLVRSSTRSHYQARWPSYRFAGATPEEARAAHVAAGIDVGPESHVPSRGEQLTSVAEYVFGDSSGIASVVEDLERHQNEGWWVNPRALKKPVEARPAGDRSAIFAEACRYVLGGST